MAGADWAVAAIARTSSTRISPQAAVGHRGRVAGAQKGTN
jgi:hypothetical protein